MFKKFWNWLIQTLADKYFYEWVRTKDAKLLYKYFDILDKQVDE